MARHELDLIKSSIVIVSALNAEQYTGSRNLLVKKIARWVYDWQIQHNCLLEVIYVNIKDNISDAPSREIDTSDEICITLYFRILVENDFSLVFIIIC